MPLTLRAVALKSLSGYGLRQWVVTFLLVATDKVVTILLNHPIKALESHRESPADQHPW